MFIVGMIGVWALMLWIFIMYFSHGAVPDSHISDFQNGLESWFIYGITFVLGSLGCIGLMTWNNSYRRKKFRTTYFK